jgi:CheY-like chemotaxis protein/HPt (histidine-containing phosphotransfer) domain-containing protein
MKILIAEDHDMTAEILVLYLQKQGFEAVVASNGREAIECLGTIHDIGLVISDLMMPEIDGFELMAELQQRPEWCGLPVVVISALADPEIVKRAAELGCRRFIVKPISAGEIVKAVQSVLAEQPETLRPPLRVMADLGVDREIYDKLIQRFERAALEIVKKLQASLGAEGPPEMPLSHAEVRRMVESAKLLGASRLAQTERQLFREDAFDPSVSDVTQIRLLLREITLVLAAIRSAASPSQAWKGSFTTLTSEDRREQRSATAAKTTALRKRVVRM